MTASYIVGIDLGTTHSCVAIWREGNLEIIPDSYGNKTIPSYVAYTNFSKYVGVDAKNQRDINPENVFYEIKRFIGRRSTDAIVAQEQDFVSYKLNTESENIRLCPVLKTKQFLTPEEIQASILGKLKQMANEYLKADITKAVITIPAYFNDSQRQSTRDAATIAGLECIRIINEPTAAGLAYGLVKRTLDESYNILVYDFGGGTLDVTLMNVSNGIFEVIASAGNTHLGGSDFDNRLMSYAIAKFAKKNKIQIAIGELPALSIQGLRRACEDAKKLLSSVNKTSIFVQNFSNDIDLNIPLSRRDLEDLCAELFLLCMHPVDEILNECSLDIKEISDVILVGGMTRMPKIRELLLTKFKKQPNCSINPEEVVAAGAAIQAYIISHQSDPFADSVTLLDTTNLSLGVETAGGIMDIIIPRNSTLPADASSMYSTDTDNTDEVTIKIYEGERTLTKDNFFVGEFTLKGIEMAPKGVPEICVTFKIDTNGCITVHAENVKTSDNSTLIVTGKRGRLTREEIERLIDESREMDVQDELARRKKMFKFEILDYCDNIIRNINMKTVSGESDEIAYKFPESEKIRITGEVAELRVEMNKVLDIPEYEKIIADIKLKYSILMMRQTGVKLDKLGGQEGTGIYDDGVQHVNEEIVVIDKNVGMTSEDVEEIKELTQQLKNLCFMVLNIISNDAFKADTDHVVDLRDYIDDVLIWVHVTDKLIKGDIDAKMQLINDACNRLMENSSFAPVCVDYKDELLELCIVIKIKLDDGIYKSSELKKEVDAILGWLQEDRSDEDMRGKIEYLNGLVVRVSQIDIEPVNVVLHSVGGVIESDGGTSLFELVRNKQQELINDKLENDDE